MVSVPPALRVVFFGTPAFAVPTLEGLLGSPHPVVGVVTQPDRPSGRGHKVIPPPVKAAAQRAGIPVLQPARLREPGFLNALAALRPDVGVVAAYGRILTDAVLQTPPRGLLNVHASLLPRYRGAAPVQRAVIAGERETGVTIMRVVAALDAGPMLARAARPIDPEETSEQVEQDLAHLGARLLVATLDAFAAGTVAETPQDASLATYAPKITREDGAVDWTWPAGRLHNLVRGLHPWPHASSILRGRRVILHRSRPLPGPADAPPGTIVEASADRLIVATGAGRLAILTLQLDGGRPMGAREFLAGHEVAAGERFGAP